MLSSIPGLLIKKVRHLFLAMMTFVCYSIAPTLFADQAVGGIKNLIRYSCKYSMRRVLVFAAAHNIKGHETISFRTKMMLLSNFCSSFCRNWKPLMSGDYLCKAI